MNPAFFAVVPFQQIMQTLVHEMAHLWQGHFGKPSRNGYHNRQWGNKMKEIGLFPSNTGKPGGRQNGQQMMDYVIEGGEFEKAYKELLNTEFGLTWYDRFPYQVSTHQPTILETLIKTDTEISVSEEISVQDDNTLSLVHKIPDLDIEFHRPVDMSKVKYHCDECNTNVWGKQGLKIVCGECNNPYISV